MSAQTVKGHLVLPEYARNFLDVEWQWYADRVRGSRWSGLLPALLTMVLPGYIHDPHIAGLAALVTRLEVGWISRRVIHLRLSARYLCLQRIAHSYRDWDTESGKPLVSNYTPNHLYTYSTDVYLSSTPRYPVRSSQNKTHLHCEESISSSSNAQVR